MAYAGTCSQGSERRFSWSSGMHSPISRGPNLELSEELPDPIDILMMSYKRLLTDLQKAEWFKDGRSEVQATSSLEGCAP